MRRPWRPPLTHEQILAWADEHKARTGKFPHNASGDVFGVTGEHWGNINHALGDGTRGLPGGDSLARLLERERGHRHLMHRPALSEALVVDWAWEHRRRTGRWPPRRSGAVVGVPGEKWSAIHTALQAGFRGLPGGDSLSRLLARHGATTRAVLGRLTEEQVIGWARAYRNATGGWPSFASPPVGLPPGEKWRNIDKALADGRRGLPGGTTLRRLLERRG